jgi:hypothetical protein
MAITPSCFYLRDNSTISPVVLTGSQSTTTLTVSAIASGTLAVGMEVHTSASTAGIITAQLTGTAGSTGTYTLSTSQTLASQTLTAFAFQTVGTVGWSAVAAWQSGHAYIAGSLVRQAATGATFTASQSTTTLTVSAVSAGTLAVGQTVYSGFSSATQTITALGTGTGGTGTYTVSSSATISSQAMMANFTPGNERVFACVVAGTSGSTEPAWVLTKGAKTTDNTATWIEVTGQPGVNGDMANTPSWVQSTAVVLGNIVKDAAGTHLFVCTTAGTTKTAPEPTWGTTAGNTTTDNTATWTCLGGVSSTWAAPAARLSNMLNTSWAQAGNYIYAAADHAEMQGTALSITSINGTSASPNYVISVAAATVPPTSASWSAGASITTVGPNALTLISSLNAGIYFYGLTAICSSGAATSALTASAAKLVIDTCVLSRASTTSAGNINIGAGSSSTDSLVIGTTLRFGNTGDRFAPGARVRTQGLTIAGSTIPTGLISTANAPILEMIGSDLGTLGANSVVNTPSGPVQITLSGCKLGSSTVISPTPASLGPLIDAINCDSAATDYQKARYSYAGTLTTDTSVVRTSGAVVDVTHVSDKIVTNANTSWINSFNSIPLAIWNSTTGSSVTMTVYGVYNGSALPNNDEVWMDVEYPGSASSPLASIGTTTKANAMTTAAAVTSDTSAWDSVATARANSTAYALGDARSVSSNTGRIFFCTTAGTSSGSLPAGYASAVDGGTVTDGTAVFRAGERFKLTSSFTPQLAGPIYVRPKAGRVSSTYYVDPLPVLS